MVQCVIGKVRFAVPVWDLSAVLIHSFDATLVALTNPLHLFSLYGPSISDLSGLQNPYRPLLIFIRASLDFSDKI